MTTHPFLTGAHSAYANVTGCLRFVGFGRCSLPESDPVHSVPTPTQQPKPADPRDSEGPTWPATGIACPNFALPQARRGPAPELGLQLHGQRPPRPRITWPWSNRALIWLDCTECHGPSSVLIGDICRDCSERSALKPVIPAPRSYVRTTFAPEALDAA